MRSMTCPLCGCGELIESDIAGYECENCGESFNTDEVKSFFVCKLPLGVNQRYAANSFSCSSAISLSCGM